MSDKPVIMMNLEKTTYAGWPNCLRLTNGVAEMIVTTDVGPRILQFNAPGSSSDLFWLDNSTEGQTGGDKWHPYGGHRFWHAPEVMPRTYVPDNSPVPYEWDGTVLRLIPEKEQLTGMQKIIEIRMDPSKPEAQITHRLVNHGPWEITAAPWALTVLAAGGTALIPQEPFIPFPDRLLPARPMVLWSYTRMEDKRFTWADEFVALRQDSGAAAPLKVGVRSTPSWGAYLLGDTAFVKSTTLYPELNYPDFGCNWECYTDKQFLELETLGPLEPIKANGGVVEHKEKWQLTTVTDPENLEKAFQELKSLVTD